MMKQMKLCKKRANLSLSLSYARSSVCINAFCCLFVHKKNIVFNLNRKTLIFIKFHALFFCLNYLICLFVLFDSIRFKSIKTNSAISYLICVIMQDFNWTWYSRLSIVPMIFIYIFLFHPGLIYMHFSVFVVHCFTLRNWTLLLENRWEKGSRLNQKLPN